ncbi:MAG: Npun_F5749 family FMN-dependent PPOX-type flavoprotein [Leptolyngbyaceae bacterium]|nr:Npun_F5749 family FMN-dependent PPOX-type flavoprotein [Leptolyngbyaceae bacterium]
MVDHSLAPWRSPLSRALHRNRSLPYARYFQLATVQSDGKPRNRTVVFRGFSDEGQIQIVTDQRSEKIEHIHHQPWGEICWYFPKTREQFRIAGAIALISHTSTQDNDQALRHQIWHDLSDNARQQFAWPFPRHPRSDASDFDIEPPSPDAPLLHFSVLLLAPHSVDHLELKGNPQDRHVYELSSAHEWKTRAVNP